MTFTPKTSISSQGVIFLMKRMKLVSALLAAAAILLRPQIAVDCAQNAMRIWYSSVAPALFPFFVLMPTLTSPESCKVYGHILSPAVGKILHITPDAVPAALIAMLAGSPAGAAALARVAGQSGMKKAELQRIAPIVCGVGPAYLVVGVGTVLLGSVRKGFQLALIQFAVQQLLLLLSGFFQSNNEEIVPRMDFSQEKNAVRSAVEAVLGVCGYMTFFSVVTGVVAELTGAKIGRILLAVLDLPSGMAAIAEWNTAAKPALLGMCMGFGGGCIAAQNLEYLAPIGVGMREFFTLKLIQSALCGAACAIFLRDFAPESQHIGLSGVQTYAFSLLMALLLFAPVLIFLSNKLFLNKTNFRKKLSVH